MSNDVADEAARSLREALARADRLLLIRLRSLGDSILTLPLIQALHAAGAASCIWTFWSKHRSLPYSRIIRPFMKR